MMRLQLSSAQYDQIARERFLDRVIAILADSYSDSRTVLYAADTREILRQQYAKAHAHGFAAERELARYLIAAWQLGMEFDTSYPAMAEILALNNIGAAQKSEAIEQVARTLFNTLQNGAKP